MAQVRDPESTVRTRNWCFTWNSPDELDHLQAEEYTLGASLLSGWLVDNVIRYGVCQLEAGTVEMTPHLQGLVYPSPSLVRSAHLSILHFFPPNAPSGFLAPLMT